MKALKSVFCLGFVLFLCCLAEAEAGTLYVAWDANTEADLEDYMVYISTTHEKAVQKQGDIASFPTTRTSFCYSISDIYDVFFVGVSARDFSGNESGVTVGFVLRRNIYGAYNDGTSYTEARVDGQDLTTLGVYFGEFVTHENVDSIDCDQDFELVLSTYKQKCDLDYNGRIDGFDLIELGLGFGKSAAQ